MASARNELQRPVTVGTAFPCERAQAGDHANGVPSPESVQLRQLALDSRMAENRPRHSVTGSLPLGIPSDPRRPGQRRAPDQSHTGVEEGVPDRVGSFTGQGRALLSRKSLPPYLLILEILCREEGRILSLHN